MAATNTPFQLFPQSQAAVRQFINAAGMLTSSIFSDRERMLHADLSYIRELDASEEQKLAKQANRKGDTTKFQNIQVPLSLIQVESAVTYQASVFLTGSPIIEAVASPEFEDQALAMNALIEENSQRTAWVANLTKTLRDGFKYNKGSVEVVWDRIVTGVLETDTGFSTTQGKPKEIIWQGNAIKHLDAYNTFLDPRVQPSRCHIDGEFAGYIKKMHRIQLKTFIQNLPNSMNVKEAFESGVGGGAASYRYYMPQLNPNVFANSVNQGEFDWFSWAGIASTNQDIQYKNWYEVVTIYARIIPKDFDIRVPASSTPQIWKFILVNGQVLIYAERQTNAHNYLPILTLVPNDDGLGYQTKSLLDNAMPFQSIVSALWNSNIASRRRAISDRAVYDPSRISSALVNSDSPTAKIPTRPNAYGKPVSDAYMAIPYRDDQAGVTMQESQALMGLANLTSGQNQARQGQFVKGNKTLSEYEGVMANSNGRDQVTAINIEAQFFIPLKEILKLNTMQFQGGISLYSPIQKTTVSIDPVKLRQAALSFKMTDGIAPTDKVIGADAFQVAMQVIGSSAQINQNYNLAPLFSYLMKTQHADLRPFEKSQQQVAYEQASQQWMQLAQLAIEKGQPFQQPQPKPQDYGYDPSLAAPQQQLQLQVTNVVKNTVNNRTDSQG